MAEEPARGSPVTRLAFSVEGQTEYEFVRSVLADHLRRKWVEATPILLGRAGDGGPGGGNVNVKRLVSDMVLLYQSFDFVTSLVDFYGFRDKGEMTVEELEERLTQEIQAKIHRGWDQRRVIAYVQRHEFEGLLFSDVTAFGTLMGASNQSVAQLRETRSKFSTPEDINDNKATAPSKRIVTAISRYQKPVDGPLVAMEIGLATIRAQCPRFHRWVTSLESLGNPT